MLAVISFLDEEKLGSCIDLAETHRLKSGMMKNIETKIMVLSLQLTLGILWILAAIPKLTNAGYRESYNESFANTFLPSIPGGMLLQVYFIGVLELITAILAIVSLMHFEAIKENYIWLHRCLAMSAVTFTILGFGLRLKQDFAGSANIFFYLAGIFVFSIFLRQIQNK